MPPPPPPINIMDQLAALPPHLKVAILAAAEQQQQQHSQTQAQTSPAPSFDHAPSHNIADPPLPLPFRFTAELDASLASAQSRSSRFFSRPMLQALATQGFFVLDGFAAAAEGPAGGSDSTAASSPVSLALGEARGLYASQQMTHAGMKAAAVASSASSGSSSWKSAALRGDHHKWLHADDEAERRAFPHLHSMVDRIDALRVELNEVLRDPIADQLAATGHSSSAAVTADGSAPSVSGSSSDSSGNGRGAGTGWHASGSIEVQVASYQGAGSRYVAHRDAVLGQAPHRRITSIVYLSEWARPQQGGCLRLHLEPGAPSIAAPAAPAAAASSAAADTAATTTAAALPYFLASSPDSPHPPPAESIFFPSATSQEGSSAASSSSPSSGRTLVDIAPIPGRLVVFASSVLLHEVMPAHDLERFAMTVWMQ